MGKRQLNYSKFNLNTRKKKSYCDGTLEASVDSPALEILKTQLNTVLSKLVLLNKL